MTTGTIVQCFGKISRTKEFAGFGGKELYGSNTFMKLNEALRLFEDKTVIILPVIYNLIR